MPDFRLIPTAPVTPTCCVFCGGNTGPFVESVPEKEIVGFGRVYVCAANEPGRSGCLTQAARLTGMLSIEQADKLLEQMKTVSDERDRLRREMNAKDEPVIVGKRELEHLRQVARASG